MRFLGNVDEALARRVADRVEDFRLQAFEVALGELGAFKRGRLARVVWLGVRSGADALASLAAQVETECVAEGLPGEQRPFTAHLTLARSRVRDGAVLPRLPALPLLRPWRATGLVLYSSHLGRAGATYEPLRSIRLEGG
jgi:2'-5' RNA ligase